MMKFTAINRGYDSKGDRQRAVAALAKRGFNYFVFYRDSQAEIALQFGNADWVTEGQIHISR